MFSRLFWTKRPVPPTPVVDSGEKAMIPKLPEDTPSKFKPTSKTDSKLTS